MRTDELGFFLTSMPKSRPADYYVGCLDGCIFMDFNNCEDGRIRLVRISFDGFGCCNMDERALPMNEADSEKFKSIIQAELADQNHFNLIVKKTLQDNKNLIWEDALNEYELD